MVLSFGGGNEAARVDQFTWWRGGLAARGTRAAAIGEGLSDRVSGLAQCWQPARDLGYQEGRDFVIEYRWADGNYDRLPTLVEDLIRLKVDVIDTHGTPGVCAKQADVRFWGKSGDEDCAAKCLLMTQSGHCCP